MNAGQIYVHLRANIANLQKGMRTAQGIVARFASRAGKLIMNIPWAKMALAASAAIGGIAFAFKKFTGSVIQAASTSENYRTRLKALLGSAQEGNRLFKEMSDFASKVPFSYEKIMGSATALAGVMKGGVDEIKRWMPLIADLAAVSGLSIEDTTSQVIRMYSAGAASADMFRERGILAMLGFKAGVSYSVEDTRKIMMEAWNKSGSQFKGATEELAKTWEGLMSMFGDLWFNFKNMVAKSGIFDYLKEQFNALKDWLNEMKDSGVMQQWAQAISDVMIKIYTKIWDIVWFIIDNWPKIQEKITEVWRNVEKVSGELFNWFVDNWDNIVIAVKAVGNAFEWIVQAIVKVKNAYNKLPDFLKGTHPVIKWIVKFLGEGSSQKPLTEKLSELSGRVNSFTSHINSQNPMYNVDVASAASKLSAVAQKASQVSSAISKSGGGSFQGAYESNYGLWTGEGGNVSLGPDEYLKQTDAGIVIAHNPKPPSALEGDRQRQENIINANVTATVEVRDVSNALDEYNRRIS